MNSHLSEHWFKKRNFFRFLAAGYLALIAATWPLWTPQTAFPQIPLIRIAGRIPQPIEWGMIAILLTSLGIMVFTERPALQRSACLLMGLATFGLVLIDQHRLQPWAWQFVILSVVLATARTSTAVTAWRWLVIGIYVWSAWSKLDRSFCLEHGPFLLDGLCRSIGLSQGTKVWPTGIRFGMAVAIPVFELLIAIGLCWQRTRTAAVVAAAFMHLGLLLALGPFGHRHQPGVLIWNVFFIIQNWLIFIGDPAELPSPVETSPATARSADWFARFVVVAAIVWPLFEPLGLCDHWPAWAVYAAKPERVLVLVDETDAAKLPEELKQYLGESDFDGWHPIRIDRWSLDALHAPIYPQDRFYVGVALRLARQFHLNGMRVAIQGPANRWTGARAIRQFDGLESIERLASDYRLNAVPR